MSPARREVLRAAGAAALLGVGAACARIPTESPIGSRALNGQSRPGAPYVRALPPPLDATPEQVVVGFVQAGVGSEDDFAVARAYLTDQASALWEPSAGITVYSSSQELQVLQPDPGRLRLVLQVVALVDAGGVRSRLAGPSSRDIEVSIQQVEGQWRLSRVPDGIFLSEAAFETLYAPARLYFLDARRRHLVPDHRWVALRRGADAVLEGLVAGPAAPLEGAVLSEIPDAVGAVDTLLSTGPDGHAQVEVPRAITALPAERRSAALSQLESSLRSLPALSEVGLVLDGQDIALDERTRIERALPGHRPIAAGPTGVISLADPGAGAPAQLVPALATTPVASPVIAQDGVLAAAQNPARSIVLITSTDDSVPLREAATGGTFVAPRIDDSGFVWTSTRTSAGVLLALSGQGAERDAKVDAPWLRGREIRALDLAADATRMLVLSADAGGARLDLCAVVRDPDGVPVSLTEPVPVRTVLTDATQAGWYDEIAAVVLGTDPGSGDQRAQIVDFAGGREALPPLVVGTDRIAGSVVAGTVWAGTADGELLRTDGDSWSATDLEGRDPFFY